jgi:hypothetical protein
VASSSSCPFVIIYIHIYIYIYIYSAFLYLPPFALMEAAQLPLLSGAAYLALVVLFAVLDLLCWVPMLVKLLSKRSQWMHSEVQHSETVS